MGERTAINTPKASPRQAPKPKRAASSAVDDEPTMVRLLEKWLRDDGYEVVSAITGEGALKRVQGEEFGCILLDLMIPEVSGLELARRFKADERTGHLPIIFMTTGTSLIS